jgi:hypothetical protein
MSTMTALQALADDACNRSSNDMDYLPISVGTGVVKLSTLVDDVVFNRRGAQNRALVACVQPPGAGKTHAALALSRVPNRHVAGIRFMSPKHNIIVTLQKLVREQLAAALDSAELHFNANDIEQCFWVIRDYSDSIIRLAKLLVLAVMRTYLDVGELMELHEFRNERDVRHRLAALSLDHAAVHDHVLELLTEWWPSSDDDILGIQKKVVTRACNFHFVVFFDEIHQLSMITDVHCLGQPEELIDASKRPKVCEEWLQACNSRSLPKKTRYNPSDRNPQDFLYAMFRAALDIVSHPDKPCAFVSCSTEVRLIGRLREGVSPFTRDNLRLFSDLPLLTPLDVTQLLEKFMRAPDRHYASAAGIADKLSGRPLFASELARELRRGIADVSAGFPMLSPELVDKVWLSQVELQFQNIQGLMDGTLLSIEGNSVHDIVQRAIASAILDDVIVNRCDKDKAKSAVSTWICPVDDCGRVIEPVAREAFRRFAHSNQCERVFSFLNTVDETVLTVIPPNPAARVRGSLFEAAIAVSILGDRFSVPIGSISSCKYCVACTTVDQVVDVACCRNLIAFPPELCGPDLVYCDRSGHLVLVQMKATIAPLGTGNARGSFNHVLETLNPLKAFAHHSDDSWKAVEKFCAGPPHTSACKVRRVVVSAAGFHCSIWLHVTEHNSDSDRVAKFGEIMLLDLDDLESCLPAAMFQRIHRRLRTPVNGFCKRPSPDAMRRTITWWRSLDAPTKSQMRNKDLADVCASWGQPYSGKKKDFFIASLDAHAQNREQHLQAFSWHND